MISILIPDWHPHKLNEWEGRHWSVKARLKAADRTMIATYAARCRAPRASGKRRVHLTIVLGPRQRAGDPDAYWKSLLDAIKHAGLIVDDNRQGVELAPVHFERDKQRATLIQLEDIDE